MKVKGRRAPKGMTTKKNRQYVATVVPPPTLTDQVTETAPKNSKYPHVLWTYWSAASEQMCLNQEV